MSMSVYDLPIDERIRLVEDLWDSIADEQGAVVLTDAQRQELDRRIDALELDGEMGHPAADVIAAIRQKL
ncbi:addiction module protein [Halochromatium glycolicum]|uniref:Addiction module protein n=1 Tax=Halochromatium glycolicum TaxID=85075 RepID=A0AAJ0U695_9GAMM|nr:addiction module protein [Halochromatium glycolicum]MBK1706064.1 addiction module protein [Halochromatium glycolicum]